MRALAEEYQYYMEQYASFARVVNALRAEMYRNLNRFSRHDMDNIGGLASEAEVLVNRIQPINIALAALLNNGETNDETAAKIEEKLDEIKAIIRETQSLLDEATWIAGITVS